MAVVGKVEAAVHSTESKVQEPAKAPKIVPVTPGKGE